MLELLNKHFNIIIVDQVFHNIFEKQKYEKTYINFITGMKNQLYFSNASSKNNYNSIFLKFILDNISISMIHSMRSMFFTNI